MLRVRNCCKTYRPGYPIEKRGMYYLARRLSSQLSLITENTDYSGLEKCYSIWICRDDVPAAQKYSFAVYEVTNTKDTSSVKVPRESYDLMTLVVIKLGDKVYNGDREEEGYDLFRFLNTIMYPHEKNFMEKVSEYIDFSQNEELWKEAGHMSGLGECVYNDGLIEGTVNGIRNLMETMDLSAEQAMAALKVPETEWQKYMELLEKQ